MGHYGLGLVNYGGHVLVHGVQNPDSKGLGDGMACLAGLDDVSYFVSLLFVILDIEGDHLRDLDVFPDLRIKQGGRYIS